MGRQTGNSEGILGVWNVLDKGCVGDGVTDDAPTLRTILNAAGSGQMVIMPPATYKLGSAVTVAANAALWLLPGVVLSGTGVLSAAVGGLLFDLRAGTFVVSGITPVLGRGALQQIVYSQKQTVLAAGNQTLTAAQLLGGLIEHPITAATTDTTDTAANIDAAIPGVANGDSFITTIANTSAGAFAITLAAGAGITLKGSTTTIGQNKVANLEFFRTGPGAWVVYVSVSA